MITWRDVDHTRTTIYSEENFKSAIDTNGLAETSNLNLYAEINGWVNGSYGWYVSLSIKRNDKGENFDGAGLVADGTVSSKEEAIRLAESVIKLYKELTNLSQISVLLNKVVLAASSSHAL